METLDNMGLVSSDAQCSTNVAIVHLLYILGIGLGRWAVNRHEIGSRLRCGDASVVWAVSWVAMSDSRLYRCRPPVVTRDSKLVYVKFLNKTDVFMDR